MMTAIPRQYQRSSFLNIRFLLGLSGEISGLVSREYKRKRASNPEPYKISCPSAMSNFSAHVLFPGGLNAPAESDHDLQIRGDGLNL
jgi:hypothetical protein